MGIDFVEKFNTGKYKIGSFDSFYYDSINLIISNNRLSGKQAKKLIDSFPDNFRASIVDNDGNYIGFIALYDCDPSMDSTSIRFEVNKNISNADKSSIIDTYKSWIRSALNFTNIEKELFVAPDYREEKQSHIEPRANIIMNNSLLEPGIESRIYDHYNDYYKLPYLRLPFTIKSQDRVLGIVGLCNVNYHNKRANLCIYLDHNIGDDIKNYLASSVIDDYIDYVHNSNIHNLIISIPGHDTTKLDIAKATKMNYFGYIPYGSINFDGILESKYMFQHIPNMIKEDGLILPKNIEKNETDFLTEKKEIDSVVDIGGGYKLISPLVFDELGINKDVIINAHNDALKNRDNFSIPLGEDKFIIQKGDGSYGTSKSVKNFNYVLLDSNNNYAGYINILRGNANKKNAEIEIGIKPGLQNLGLGKRALNAFYEQLFSIGYASVTSAVFSFNEPSLRLHDKVAKLDGVRIESYYINDRLWDMSFYSKVNDLSDNKYK